MTEKQRNKYDIMASKVIGDKKTYSELISKVDHFDLSFWNDYKVKEQMSIDFSCRKKNLVEGLYMCKLCGTNKVYTQSIQLRAGDEATSNFALCSNPECKSKPWEI
uniref:TFIIS-type domain-containing protein n=1 Tax=viral metagenome TaxID=1070528 RepID=A0A6C0JVH8_9ZZZZ